MIENKRVLAVIPARGGSKRLPRKNILDLNGKPLIAWTIIAAKESKYVDRVVVSTDDTEISTIAKVYDAEVPFLRPSELSSDIATTNDVILHAIENLNERPDVILILQPTSPLRTSAHIDECLELMMKKSATGMVSVTPCEHNPLWSNTIPRNGTMSHFLSDDAFKRGQDLEKYYRLNGAIYVFTTESLIKNDGIKYTEGVFSYVMSNISSVDIDNDVDFKWANFLIQHT